MSDNVIHLIVRFARYSRRPTLTVSNFFVTIGLDDRARIDTADNFDWNVAQCRLFMCRVLYRIVWKSYITRAADADWRYFAASSIAISTHLRKSRQHQRNATDLLAPKIRAVHASNAISLLLSLLSRPPATLRLLSLPPLAVSSSLRDTKRRWRGNVVAFITIEDSPRGGKRPLSSITWMSRYSRGQSCIDRWTRPDSD